MDRRGLLRGIMIGALAAPAGTVISKELADQLALPPPQPKTGDKLILLSQRGRAVINASDFLRCNAELTLLNDDGSVLGVFMVATCNMRIGYHSNIIEYTHLNDVYSRGGGGTTETELDVRLVRVR